MNKEEKINIRTSKKMKSELEKIAEANKRELSDYVRLLYQYAIDNKIKL